MNKIIFDNIIYDLQKIGGISKYWFELTNRFKNSKSFEILFCNDDNSTNNIYRNNQSNSNTITIKKKINERFSNPTLKGIDYKHIFHSSYYRYSKNKNSINVTTVHDFTHSKTFSIRNLVHEKFKFNTINKSDFIICISETTKSELLKYLPNVAKEKISVVYNGVSDEFKNLKLSSKGYMLFVGSRTSYKNFNVAVELVKIAKLPFKIVGSALTKDELELLNNNKINFESCINISDFELSKIYNEAHCLIYPSSYEGFGIPIVEAMKCGCPVITYRKPYSIEVAGDAALYLEKLHDIIEYKRILEQLNDNKIRENLIQNGLTNSDRFSWDKNFLDTKNIYESLLK